MQGKGQVAISWALSGLLAFSLFGFAGISYAEPAASGTDDSATGARACAVVLDDVEAPALGPIDSSEVASSESADAMTGLPDGNDDSDGEDDGATDALDPGVAPPEAEALASAMSLTLAMPLSSAVPAAEGPAADAPLYAQPGPDDFEFSDGVITKIKASYINGLTNEQRQDVRLDIPATIGGKPVIGIGDSAFYSYTYSSFSPSPVFTRLDLSQATALTSIGDNAFRYARNLAGDLIIPDTVTSIGESAFADCGFTGALHLPRNAAFGTVPAQAFLNTQFTGTLEIPSNIKVIDRKSFEGTGFSGTLVIPEGVKEVWASAFASCAGITSVSIPSTLDFKKRDSDSGHQFRNCTSLREVSFAPSSRVTSLFSEMFAGCASLRVLELPDSITNVDAKAFYSCGLKTVYLPASAMITANAGSFLYNCPGAVAVCKDKASYESYKAQFPVEQQKFLSYPITVTFDAGSYGTNPEPITRLYDRPFNMVEIRPAGGWAVDEAYSFPLPGGVAQPPDGAWFAWSFDAAGSNQASETTATGTTGNIVLYGQGLKTVQPTVSFNYPARVGKVYDGEDMELTVTAEHPLAVDPSNVGVGDYVFAYRWMLYDSSKGTATVKQQGFDNTFRLRDVADSQTGPTKWYLVYVFFYQVTDLADLSDIFSNVNRVAKNSFYVQIQPADSSVHPSVAPGAGNLDGFPALSVSDGDTPGSVAWDAGQTLEDGTHSYTWTFTPDPPAAGKPANYKSASGAMDLRVVNGRPVQQVSFDTAGGPALDPIDVPCAEPLPAAAVPARDGYVFLGWYRDAACTQPWDALDPVTGDMTLHARWEQRVASVDPGEGNVVVNGEAVDPGSHVVDIVHEPEVAPEDEEALKNVELPAGAAPSAFFELKLVVDGAEVEKAEFDRALSVSVAYPVQEGARYHVAHLRHDGSTELLDAVPDVTAQTLTFSVGSLSPFMVLERLPYRVMFDSAGGSVVAPLDVLSGEAVPEPSTPTRTGFAFVGWFKDAAGTKVWDFARDAVTSDTTLYAVWKAADGEGPGGSGGGSDHSGGGPGRTGTVSGDNAQSDSVPSQEPGGANGPGSNGAARAASVGSLADTGDPAAIPFVLALVAGMAALAFAVRRARHRMR